MCGFAGVLEVNRRSTEAEMVSRLADMTKALTHRGPDSQGTWIDAAAGLGFGHTRLAVIDLSAAGHQPMISADERYVIAYNGEIYNHEELREELSSVVGGFRGHSDTEVILEACAAWGVESTARRLIGMFTFALWDRRDRTLRLVRDRFGIKPLYWGYRNGLFLFASELKALRIRTDWDATLSEPALAGYLQLGYVPGPLSIYEGIFKLEPGCLLSFKSGGEPQITRFWDTIAVVRDAVDARRTIDEGTATDALEQLLRDAVRRRMIADVPLGAFLSGGIDSSLVTAIMQAESKRPVLTFSIGFHEREFDESRWAGAVARHLKTDHTELHVEPGHALETIPLLPEWFDEPFGDPSQIPTYLLSAMTRRHVTVALTGDGGDELFMGYDRYRRLPSVLGLMQSLPSPLRRSVAPLARFAAGSLNDLARRLPSRLGGSRVGRVADLGHRLADLLPAASAEQFYWLHHGRWDEPGKLLLSRTNHTLPTWSGAQDSWLTDPGERMQLYDMLRYLPDDILTKVDRASMAVALEARVPLLDHRIAEFAWRLPRNLKERQGRGKWLLRQVLHRFVPPELVERPKQGFGVPIGRWLRGPLRDWAEDLLSEQRLAADGLLEARPIRARWLEHLSGRRNWEYSLWVLLMFQAWKQRWMPA
jgi:asparagine synthase (glutamine-hydrolysing)